MRASQRVLEDELQQEQLAFSLGRLSATIRLRRRQSEQIPICHVMGSDSGQGPLWQMAPFADRRGIQIVSSDN